MSIVVYVVLIENMGGFIKNEVWVFIDLVCLFPLALLAWMAFFSQFVLPVDTFRSRQRIFDRLLLHLSGMHGPAIFVRDGDLVKSGQEEERKGPGVLWLDSASGVVTRTDTAFRNSFGPGVHFTEKDEKIAGTVDLHSQNHSVGPKEIDDPFAPEDEKNEDEEKKAEYKAVQSRRNKTSALTRDGIEIVPNINVGFKINAEPVKDSNLPGSRFGFNEESVRLAVMGQAINPSLSRETDRYLVPWNQLPALLAVDIWRDLVGKFTVNDLFDAKFNLPPSFPNPLEATTAFTPVDNPTRPQGETAEALTNILMHVNQNISRLSDWIKEWCNPKKEEGNERGQKSAGEKKKEETKDKKVTGLQVINFLLKERLQKHTTALLDRYGIHQVGHNGPSPEYAFLTQRGIRVNSASVSNLRMPRDVNEKLLKRWTANWLKRAQDERNNLDQEDGFQRIANEDTSLRDYIKGLSDDLLNQAKQNKAGNLKDALRALMLESRALLVKETQQYRQASPEREDLEEIIQWLEGRDI